MSSYFFKLGTDCGLMYLMNLTQWSLYFRWVGVLLIVESNEYVYYSKTGKISLSFAMNPRKEKKTSCHQTFVDVTSFHQYERNKGKKVINFFEGWIRNGARKRKKTSHEARNSAKINLHKYTVTENYDTWDLIMYSSHSL